MLVEILKSSCFDLLPSASSFFVPNSSRVSHVKKEFFVFIFLEIRSNVHNCGRQFSNGITKKRDIAKREWIRRKARSRSILPLFLDRSVPLSLYLSQYRTSRDDITTLLRSSRNIPRSLTIFIPFYIAFLRPVFFFPVTQPVRFFPPILRRVRILLLDSRCRGRVGNVRRKLILPVGKSLFLSM